ncbi:MAG: plasmid pRiA4b ORF-3 family protein [Cyanobacteria bacterium P01_A01_bin.135]
MAFDLAQLDAIADIDEAMETLEEEYIPELLEAFANSPEGQARLAAQPPEEQYLGDWAGNLVFFGYAYLEVTLPKMKARDVEEIVLGLFPRKVMLPDPEDAEAIVPELIAFWQFLQREFKLRHSKKILAFLEKSGDRVQQAMTNPQNFGIAKSFMSAGMEAGFDMTSQEGISAFQEQYNQQVRAGGPPITPPAMPGMPGMAGMLLSTEGLSEDIPPEFVALLSQQMGIPLPPELKDLPTDPEALVASIAQHLVDTGAVTIDENASEGETQEIRETLLELQASLSILADDEDDDEPIDLPELPQKVVTRLQEQQITEVEPGTLLKDIQILIDVLKEGDLPVSQKLNQWPGKTLVDLNQRLTNPIQVDLKRPQQKSFPNLHGLHMLLRASGIAEITHKGKKAYLTLNPDILASWETLNPTERYFNLLEAWLIRAHEGHLGEEARSFHNGWQTVNAWDNVTRKQTKFKDYGAQQTLNYWPGLYTLALMQLFGWLKITSPKPDPGKGWRIEAIAPLPLGDAMISAVKRAYIGEGFDWPSEENASTPWGQLQPYLGEYFPEWRQNLVAPEPPEHQLGTYIFKVHLKSAWRRLSISSEQTLHKFGALIRRSVDFDSDHLDMFVYRDIAGRQIQLIHPWCDDGMENDTSTVVIGDLPLQPGDSMTYVFDFGDNWQFTVLLEEIQPGKPKRNATKILEAHGEAPEQYPDWDEE